MMRLNRVESFNGFAARTARRTGWPWLAARGSRLRLRSPARGRLATANPSTCRGGRLQSRPPYKWVADHLQGAAARRRNSPQGAAASGEPARDDRRRPARKGQPPVTHPQEAAHGAPAWGGRQWPARKGLPPAGVAAPAAGVAAPWQGGYRSQHTVPPPA
ncbi:hypothetical protein BHM03_00049829 [Ensete ventricosum]|nr:hypothetical protein BHM03_00049829 [Ensete ventricosum]